MTQSTLENIQPLLTDHSDALKRELKDYVQRHQQAFREGVFRGGGLEAGHQYSRALDGLLGAVLCAVRSMLDAGRDWDDVELAAVGSYGRGTLSYCSDLDVRLLCRGEPTTAGPMAEALLYPLWDAGLTIGHQVVAEEEMLALARQDLPTATTLLDWRPVAGNLGVSRGLFVKAFDGIFAEGRVGEFLRRLEERAAEREERYGGSVYALEPDVRNGPGGLRDLDVCHWIARSRWCVRSPKDLVRVGVLVPREWQQIELAQAMIWRIRTMLHAYSGRRMDRLSFDRQEQVAHDMGYGEGPLAVEKLMSDYYRQARAVIQARDMLFARAAPPPTRRPHEIGIGKGLKLINGQVTLAHPGALESDPALALRLYREALERDRPIYAFARNAIARAASLPAFCERLRAAEEAGPLFVKLCTHVAPSPFKRGSVLRELHDVGLLVAMIPEFAPVVGRVHHDVYHVYTVDVHSLKAVDRLRALSRGDLASEHPLASRLAAEITRPRVLFFATLLHDIGKDIGGQEHSERGAVLACDILARLGLGDAEILEVQHLIRVHLRMYHVATRRDMDDPLTLAEFAREVHGHEGLRDLYLLTVSDVSTTSPTALTDWVSRMLEELYFATERWLSEGDEREESTEAICREVEARWQHPEAADFLQHFLAAMPERYLYANHTDDILRHAAFALRAEGKPASVACVTEASPYVELVFIANDRPGLLAMKTATLAAHGLQVVGAQIYSWVDTGGAVRSLDVFWVAAGSRVEKMQALVPKLEGELTRMLRGDLDPGDLAIPRSSGGAWASRPTPPVQTTVSFDNRASAAHTVIEVTARDRPGLLFALSRCLQLAGLRIALAKINTEGTAVADVFYVAEEDGTKVTDRARIEELKRRIEAAAAGC